MATEKQSNFTVIKNKELINKQSESLQTNPIKEVTANPYYEKLMQFAENQKKKRFTVEDLLKW